QPIPEVDSEPVAYIFKHPAGRLFWALTDESNKGQSDVIPVYAAPQPAPVVQPVMFIDGDISTEDADKLAKVIREFNEEDERPLAKMARIIRENPHPTNECDMPKAQRAPVTIDERAAFNAWNNEDNLPIAGVGAKNAAWLAWQARARLGSPPAPVVPDKMTYQDGVLFVLNNDMSSIERGTVAMRAWNACRAAMLNGGNDE
ncbi:hypothetical protein JQX69_28395, partial [Klebsiella oxytoca]|nr:hypothetical protein [Klebsiella oxytoca]